jgi:hypothetical protein
VSLRGLKRQLQDKIRGQMHNRKQGILRRQDAFSVAQIWGLKTLSLRDTIAS